MSENWTVIDTLRHARHEWLNRLQLIKGNLSMGKTEQAKRIIDEIVLEMQQEALLSNLQLPRFAEILLTHNWKGHCFRLEYEVIDFRGKMPLDDRRLADWTKRFFDELNRASLPVFDNHLYLAIEPEGDAVRFLFHFHGIMENEQTLKHWLLNETYPDDIAFEQVSENEWQIQVWFGPKLAGMECSECLSIE
jgi:stage 0 sporulation protein B (sporulation initiation phosphotransferase)